MIEVTDLTVTYGGVVALDDVSIHLTADVIGLIGPNGAGKTTLINAFYGFAPVTGGSISVHGRDLLTMPPHARARWGVARSFQKVQIVPDLTVQDHLQTVLDGKGLPRSACAAEIARILDFLDISHLRHRHGFDLNPFEARMTEIGKCLVGGPRIVLLDEPGGGLSEAETVRLRRVITRIHSEFGAQVLLVDHDVDLIRNVCSVTAVLDFGKLIAFGPTADVLANEVVKAAYLGK